MTYGVSVRTQERQRWKLMLRRCHDPNGLGYRYYGARGIRVCDRWHDFETYFADIMQLIGPCPDSKSLDRIDNNGDYEPGNVRWATAAEQQRNSRQYKEHWPHDSREAADYLKRQTVEATR